MKRRYDCHPAHCPDCGPLAKRRKWFYGKPCPLCGTISVFLTKGQALREGTSQQGRFK